MLWAHRGRRVGVTLPIVQLDPATIERIVQRTAARTNELVLANLLELAAELRAERTEAPPAPVTAQHDDQATAERRLVDAQTLAGILGCSRDCVYAHAAELGGQRIGDGPRGRLRFDTRRALEAWTSRSCSEESQKPKMPASPRVSARRDRKRMGSGPDLLPIKGAERP